MTYPRQSGVASVLRSLAHVSSHVTYNRTTLDCSFLWLVVDTTMRVERQNPDLFVAIKSYRLSGRSDGDGYPEACHRQYPSSRLDGERSVQRGCSVDCSTVLTKSNKKATSPNGVRATLKQYLIRVMKKKI